MPRRIEDGSPASRFVSLNLAVCVRLTMKSKVVMQFIQYAKGERHIFCGFMVYSPCTLRTATFLPKEQVIEIVDIFSS
jgi:hypothetical protein